MTLITCKQGSYSGGVFRFRKYLFRYQNGISGQTSCPRWCELDYFKYHCSDIIELSGVYLRISREFV